MGIEWIQIKRARGRHKNPRPQCYLSKNYLTINRRANELFFDDTKKYALLGYDKTRNVIAIKQLSEPQMGVRKISYSRQGYITIAIKMFLEYIKLDCQKIISCCDCYKEQEGEDEYIVCDLNTGISDKHEPEPNKSE